MTDSLTNWLWLLIECLQHSQESELLYEWRFTGNQCVLEPGPLRFTTRVVFFLQLNTCRHNPYVLLSSLRRGWVCLWLTGVAFVKCTYRILWLQRERERERERESCITTDGQSASLYWCQAPIWGLWPDFYYCQTIAGLLLWGALSDERTGLSYYVQCTIVYILHLILRYSFTNLV
jgi:hypothetical protein